MGERYTNIGPITIVVISSLFVLFEKSFASNDCKFPAIFNFGDSNSDTGSGGLNLKEPHGITWVREGGVRERDCDGRLIIDFFAEKLGFPYLRGYPAEGANYRNGVNFAVFAASITRTAYNDDVHAMDRQQEDWFIEFRNKTLELHASKGDQPNRPKPDDFSKALYTIDIGQNDIAFTFTPETTIPYHLLRLMGFIENLYKLDARRFWIHNTGPLGCLNPRDQIPKDELGCSIKPNERAQEYNRQLKEVINKLRDKYKDALFVYVDVYSAKYSLYKDAAKLGFKDPFGAGLDKCSDTKSETCRPKEYILWDGSHYTEAANKIVAERIMDGSLSDPPVPLTGACPSTESPKTEL